MIKLLYAIAKLMIFFSGFTLNAKINNDQEAQNNNKIDKQILIYVITN